MGTCGGRGGALADGGQALGVYYRRGESTGFQERVRDGGVCDFVERAEDWMGDEGEKGEWAWTAGIVLEQHLRKL